VIWPQFAVAAVVSEGLAEFDITSPISPALALPCRWPLVRAAGIVPLVNWVP
jgi:hypothetical protein